MGAGAGDRLGRRARSDRRGRAGSPHAAAGRGRRHGRVERAPPRQTQRRGPGRSRLGTDRELPRVARGAGRGSRGGWDRGERVVAGPRGCNGGAARRPGTHGAPAQEGAPPVPPRPRGRRRQRRGPSRRGTSRQRLLRGALGPGAGGVRHPRCADRLAAGRGGGLREPARRARLHPGGSGRHIRRHRHRGGRAARSTGAPARAAHQGRRGRDGPGPAGRHALRRPQPPRLRPGPPPRPVGTPGDGALRPAAATDRAARSTRRHRRLAPVGPVGGELGRAPTGRAGPGDRVAGPAPGGEAPDDPPGAALPGASAARGPPAGRGDPRHRRGVAADDRDRPRPAGRGLRGAGPSVVAPTALTVPAPHVGRGPGDRGGGPPAGRRALVGRLRRRGADCGRDPGSGRPGPAPGEEPGTVGGAGPGRPQGGRGRAGRASRRDPHDRRRHASPRPRPGGVAPGRGHDGRGGGLGCGADPHRQQPPHGTPHQARRLQWDAAHVPGRRAAVAELLGADRPGRLPRLGHGAGQDPHDAGPHLPHSRQRPVAGGRAARGGGQLGQRGPPVRARPAGGGPPRPQSHALGAGAGHGGAGRPGGLHLRHHHARPGRAGEGRVVDGRARRGPGHQEPRQRDRPAAAPARCPLPGHTDRHPDRERPGRPVVHHGLLQPGPAGSPQPVHRRNVEGVQEARDGPRGRRGLQRVRGAPLLASTRGPQGGRSRRGCSGRAQRHPGVPTDQGRARHRRGAARPHRRARPLHDDR